MCYGHLPPITKTIQVRRTRHAGHCWRSRDELIRDVLLWIPTHGRAKAGRPARTYIQQLCEDTGCCPEDLPRAMNDREEWRERVRDIRAASTIWWWWWWWWWWRRESYQDQLISSLSYLPQFTGKLKEEMLKRKKKDYWTQDISFMFIHKTLTVSEIPSFNFFSFLFFPFISRVSLSGHWHLTIGKWWTLVSKELANIAQSKLTWEMGKSWKQVIVKSHHYFKTEINSS